jgi:DNA polymerase elongation subunit (family B)
MKVIFSDTDSIGVDFEDENLFSVMKKSKDLEQKINNSFDGFVKQYNIKNHFFSIKLEKICKAILFVPRRGTGTAKKRYAYLPFWVDGKKEVDITYMGFQNKRCDNSKLAKSFQKLVIKSILTGKSGTIVPLTKMVREGIVNGDFNDDIIGIPGGYNRTLDKYKSIPISVKSAENSNRLFGTHYAHGDRFLWLYVNLEEKTLAFEKSLPTGVKINTEETIRRTLTGPLENIFKAVGYDWFELFPKPVKEKKKRVDKNSKIVCKKLQRGQRLLVPIPV